MRTATEPELRAAFVNCSKGEAKRLHVPRDLAERPWEDLDFIGWSDPGAPDRNYLVAERDGDLVGVVLRAAATRSASGRSDRPGLCGVCVTPQPAGAVRLMTALKAGAAGRAGNSTGTYLCSDLACSLYTRGLRKPASGGRFEENLTVEQRIARTRENLFAFLGAVTTP
jgi:treble-clef zinc-finger protein